MILDQSTDLDGRLAARLGLTKAAGVVGTAAPEALGADQFADAGRRLFPTHTAAATRLSAAYFYGQRPAYREKEAALVDRRLKAAAAFHGISRSVAETQRRAEARAAAPAEDLLPDEDFALAAGGVRRFPLRTPQEVKAAADYFGELRREAPYRLRRAYAERVLEKAAACGLKLPNEDQLARAAGRGACSAKDAAALILDRVLVSRRGPGLGPVRGEMLKLARSVASRPSQVRAPGALAGLAETVDQFDAAFGLTRHRGEAGFPYPEDGLFAVTKEAVASLVRDNVETASGSLYRLADLERLRVRPLREAMGDGFADAVSRDGLSVDSEKAASALKGLPRADAELFDVVAREGGVCPWATSARAEQTQLPREYLRPAAAV